AVGRGPVLNFHATIRRATQGRVLCRHSGAWNHDIGNLRGTANNPGSRGWAGFDGNVDSFALLVDARKYPGRRARNISSRLALMFFGECGFKAKLERSQTNRVARSNRALRNALTVDPRTIARAEIEDRELAFRAELELAMPARDRGIVDYD